MAKWDYSYADEGTRLRTHDRAGNFIVNLAKRAHDGEFISFHQGMFARLHIARTKSTHVATMDADRWLIVMDSPVDLGIPYVRKEAA